MKSQESKAQTSTTYIQSPFCVDQLIIAVASLNIWRSYQSDSSPDIPGKILLPGPRKWTKVTRPSLAVGEGCGLWTRLSDDLNSKWRLLLAENELSRVSLLSIGN